MSNLDVDMAVVLGGGLKTKMDDLVSILLGVGLSLGAAEGLFRDAYLSAGLALDRSNVTATARRLGVHRNTVHNFVRDHPDALGRPKQKHDWRGWQRTEQQLRTEYLIERGKRDKRKGQARK